MLRVGLLAAVLALAGCSAAPTPTVSVFAAASLSTAFEEIAAEFEADNPGTEVSLNFGSSSALAQQIEQGAPADVIATANPQTMATVEHLTEASTVFATNSLVIAVPEGNPGAVSTLDDLASPERIVAVCAPEVPCGALAAEVFSSAGVTPSIDHFAADAEALITLVELGEVDAALAYCSDIQSRSVESIETGVENSTHYPIAKLRAARYPDAARAFIDFVLSERGHEILTAAGFDSE